MSPPGLEHWHRGTCQCDWVGGSGGGGGWNALLSLTDDRTGWQADIMGSVVSERKQNWSSCVCLSVCLSVCLCLCVI